MTRLVACGLAVLALMAAPAAYGAETVDAKFKKLDPDMIHTQEHTADQCRNLGHVVTITSTTDGDVTLKPGETKYFEIKKGDEWTQSGGFYWKCGANPERARMRGATYVRAVRSAEDGHVDWYWVTIKIGK